MDASNGTVESRAQRSELETPGQIIEMPTMKNPGISEEGSDVESRYRVPSALRNGELGRGVNGEVKYCWRIEVVASGQSIGRDPFGSTDAEGRIPMVAPTHEPPATKFRKANCVHHHEDERGGARSEKGRPAGREAKEGTKGEDRGAAGRAFPAKAAIGRG